MPFHANDSLALGAGSVHIDDWSLTSTTRGNPVCPFCGAKFAIVAANSVATSRHFAHPARCPCPMVAGYAIPYAALTKIPKDPARAEALRRSFLLQRYQIFNKCSYLAKNLSFDEFRQAFENFNRHNAWEYKGLQMKYIPYVLLTFLTLYPAIPVHRPDEFFFLIEPRTGNLGDLWIRPENIAQRVLQVYPTIRSSVVPHLINDDLASYSNVAPTGFAASAAEAFILAKLR